MMKMHELHKMSATGDEDGVFATEITNQSTSASVRLLHALLCEEDVLLVS
jgi:hypothetical protein